MMNKTMMTLLASALLAGSAFASSITAPVPAAQVIAKHGADDKQPDDRGGRRYGEEAKDQLAKRGADDKQRDDRGGNRFGDDSRGEQVAREGGVRGRGRGV